jgi:hypothetical protein
MGSLQLSSLERHPTKRSLKRSKFPFSRQMAQVANTMAFCGSARHEVRGMAFDDGSARSISKNAGNSV